jgi:SAM-dependent methyltransferase
MDTSSGEDLVRAGYDALSHRYSGDDDSAEEYGPWLADLQTHLPDRGDVLDIGCGCGLPVARCLAAAGHRVTGADISDVQIERARRLVPDATFIREDAAQLRFSLGSFDAIICLYALIDVPLDQQPRLLRSIAERLRPGGWLLATTGQDAWTGTQDNLAWRPRDVVEPRRCGHLPVMAPAGRLGGHPPAIRSRGQQRPRPLLGPAATPPTLQFH